jgi:aspartyl-tRNA(Asn)/glutamyl-tRNA(Gln) amidotransferase subunit B
LSEYDAYNITDNKGIALYYEALIAHTSNYKTAANWLMGDVKSYLNEFGVEIEAFPITPSTLAKLIELIDSGKISHSAASQKLFPELVKTPEAEPLILAEKLNLIQDSSEDSILGFIQQVIVLNPAEVERYRNGEKQLTGFFMGQLMKISKGKADPKAANELMRKTLEG